LAVERGHLAGISPWATGAVRAGALGRSNEGPVQAPVTADRYVAEVHEQSFAVRLDSEQVFVVQWAQSEQVFG
jgi:hypothetical protein